MRDIGKNIRDLRQQKSLTQEELAALLYVTRQTISNYENGKSRPDVEMICRIAEVLECDANTVFYGPPAAEDRKKDCIRHGISVGILLLLGWLLIKVREYGTWLSWHEFEPSLSYICILLLDPMWMTLVGWASVQGLCVLLKVKRPTQPWIAKARWVFLVLIALYIIVILPDSLYFAGRIYEWYVGKNNPITLFEAVWYDDVILQIMLFNKDHVWTYIFSGGLWWLVRSDSKSPKKAEEVEAAKES